MIIAIDGPAGSGKSSTATTVAKILDFKYLDTGAMYRAVALSFLNNHVDISNPDEIINRLRTIDIKISDSNSGLKIILNGKDETDAIRSHEVTDMVSEVSEIGEVREFLVPLQREYAEGKNIIAEGRDIGTVVFPNAELKIFLKASESERVKRRLKEYEEKGIESDYEQVYTIIQKRDTIDSTRKHSPLVKADDAIEVDTTKLVFDEQVKIIIDLYEQRISKSAGG
ncbi:MAG: (d)CMP kinase [candidate division Zixibacteria bacterium]|nr:(d)CMP kinase [candidate division Zixibacteria bacterium]